MPYDFCALFGGNLSKAEFEAGHKMLKKDKTAS